MSVRERSIALFESVHMAQLEHAHRMLRKMPRGAMWRIALREKIALAVFLKEDMPCDSFQCIDVKLIRNGRQLEVADEGSQKAIERWEERYGDEMPWVFDVPLAAMMEGDDVDRDQAGSSGAR